MIRRLQPQFTFWMICVSLIASGVCVAATEDSALYFPPKDSAWATVDPTSVGWDAAKLDAVLDYAGVQKSSGVVILYNGKILAERHWSLSPKPMNAKGQPNGYYYMKLEPLANGHSREDVASTQKSIVSTLVGIAKHKGLVTLDDPVHQHLGAGWSNASSEQESQITLRHLISMDTGLNIGLRYEKAPGTKWMYNTPAYSVSLRVVAAAAGMSNNELTGAWLTDRIGMSASRWELRPWAEQVEKANTVGFATTARDLARFGLLVLAEGEWAGETIIGDKAYLRESLQPSQPMNPKYGYLWWLNQPHEVNRGGRKSQTKMIAAAPNDLIAAHGALGRKVHIVPSLNLVVTRLGDQPEQAFNNELWMRIMAANKN